MFYNPAMAFDRDLNVAVLRAWRRLGHPVRHGWEMLAATGVRGLRLLYEAGPFEAMLLTEGSPVALEVLRRNVAPVAPPATAAAADARAPPREAPFDYVDLDPYGTPVPFLEAAVSTLRPSGLVAVTATDMRVLAGVDRGAAERRYHGRPVRGRLGPEGGLRLLLAELWRHADAAGRSLRPELAYVGTHHVRVYATLPEGREAAPVGEIDPASWSGPPLGAADGRGPMWLGRLFDPELVEALEVPPTAQEPHALSRWLARLGLECRVDTPFYYESNTLAQGLGLDRPPSLRALAAELGQGGYTLAPTHAREGGFRTEAPYARVAEAARRAAQPQNERVRA